MAKQQALKSKFGFGSLFKSTRLGTKILLIVIGVPLCAESKQPHREIRGRAKGLPD